MWNLLMKKKKIKANISFFMSFFLLLKIFWRMWLTVVFSPFYGRQFGPLTVLLPTFFKINSKRLQGLEQLEGD